MSKGTIKTNLGDGQYTVTLNFDRDRVTEKIVILDGRIADLTAKIEEMEEGIQKSMAQLQLTSLEKKKAFLQDPKNVPADEDIDLYCADLTTNLSGEVGIIDIPGEGQYLNIQPGYGGNAAYNAQRDGQFQHAWGGTPSSVFYNLAMLPGWQKWMPTYRYGIISNLDGDTCDVTLDPATSTQQGIDVNQAGMLTGITIEYMSCNGAAFQDGDEVIVKFAGQNWTSPKVIGFKEKPKVCGWEEVWGATLCENHTWTVYGAGGSCILINDEYRSQNITDGIFHQSVNRDTGSASLKTMTTDWGSFEGVTPTAIKIKLSAGVTGGASYALNWAYLRLKYFDPSWAVKEAYFIFAITSYSEDYWKDGEGNVIGWYVGPATGDEIVITLEDYIQIQEIYELELMVSVWLDGTAEMDVDYIRIY